MFWRTIFMICPILKGDSNMFSENISHSGKGAVRLYRGRKGQAQFVVAILLVVITVGLLMLSASPAIAAADCQAQHTVRAGDTLAKIGQQYGVSWSLIAQANSIANPNRIYVGQVLCIPAAGTTPPPTGCATRHTVQPGENLFRISLRYGLSWSVVAQANNLTNANIVYVGQQLCIPTGGGTNPPPPPVGTIPTFTIVSVVANQSVTIQTSNFPANQQFDVLMGAYGTKGVNGVWVTTTASGNGGSFTTTYTIPASLRGLNQIAIRLQSPSGYFSYNWFHNAST
jgi:LysM repeat protein